MDTKREGKHPLEYAIFAFLVLTAIATGVAACYTRNQWLTAADTEQRQLRAYVTVINSYVDQFQNNQPIIISFNLKNFGLTPARHVRTEWASGLSPKSETSIYSIDDYRHKGGAPNYVTLFPSQEFAATTFATNNPAILSESEKQFVDSGTKVVIFYGTIYYDDVFENRQGTDFCYFYTWNDIRVRHWNQCRNHQGTDDEIESDLLKRR